MTQKQAQEKVFVRHMANLASRACVVAAALCSVAAAMQSQVAPKQCGYDRWPVKTLADRDARKVDFRVVEMTIAKLTAIPIHEIPYPYDRRIAPEELRVYKVQAKLLRVRPESDSDLHLLLADVNNENRRMIAEIPAPECALGSGQEDKYRLARETALTLHPGVIVDIVGVGFFDFLHEQKGAAPNGIELPSVLSINSR